MTEIVALADAFMDASLDHYPLTATLLGIPGRDDRLPDYTEVGEAAYGARVGEVAARAEAIDPATLSATDRVTRAVIVQQAETARDWLAAALPEFTITDWFASPVSALWWALPMVVIGSREQADGYLARLAALPGVIAAVTDRHRAGIARGLLPVRHHVEATIRYFDRYLADPEGDPLRRPQPGPDAGVDAESFATERDRQLAEAVRPAIGRYRDALATEILPHGRPADRGGLCWLPDGEAIYARLIRVHTTTARTPDDLHRTGLDLMDRLAEEYVTIGAEVFGAGTDLATVLARLRDDPALRWRTGDELLAAARAAVTRAESVAPQWFGRLPSSQCVVAPVPAEGAEGAPGAYYLPPALDGSRPGTYFANTSTPSERLRYDCESTTYHEAVPGHHFQMTLALDLADLPVLRRIADVNAYTEGWGLYSERLADEMGLYSDQIQRLGMVTNDAMRAARLVVDTGLHAKGWSRQQAVDYMVEHTAMAKVDIDFEVDRYLSDPGQALAYMVGRLEIQRIRADAERALGDRFDIRAFHDTVLGSGPLPLGVLDGVVREWADR